LGAATALASVHDVAHTSLGGVVRPRHHRQILYEVEQRGLMLGAAFAEHPPGRLAYPQVRHTQRAQFRFVPEGCRGTNIMPRRVLGAAPTGESGGLNHDRPFA
jgi:hypothetical protein